MAIFYFHIRDGDAVSIDDIGIDLPSLESARHEARAGARSIIAENVLGGESVDISSVFEICDENGDVVSIISFKDVVSIH